MGDQIRRGMGYLARRFEEANASQITYHRGAHSVLILATRGTYVFRLSDDNGIRIERSDRDYIFATAALVIDGSPTTPQREDYITDTDENGNPTTFHVAAPTGEPPWRYDGGQEKRIRVHTKRTE